MTIIIVLLIVAGGYWCWKRMSERAQQGDDAFRIALDNMRESDTDLDDSSSGNTAVLSGFRKAKRGTKAAYHNIADPVHRFFSRVNCDKCCAESRFVAFKGNMSLFFCSHHSKAYSAALINKGFTLLPNHEAELAA